MHRLILVEVNIALVTAFSSLKHVNLGSDNITLQVDKEQVCLFKPTSYRVNG